MKMTKGKRGGKEEGKTNGVKGRDKRRSKQATLCFARLSLISFFSLLFSRDRDPHNLFF